MKRWALGGFLAAILVTALFWDSERIRADLAGTPAQVAGGLSTPWETQPLPDGRILITELPGRVRVVQGGSLLATPALTGDGSVRKFLGLALDPSFASNSFVYLYVGYTTGGGCSTNPDTTPCKNRVVRYTLSGNSLISPSTIFDNIPSDGNHDGGRIKFGPDGKLYVTTGDIHNPNLPQNLDSPAGKILRLNADGSVPAGNPFSGSGVRQYVWSYGHRHPQGIAWDAGGRLFETEHGPSGESYAQNRCCRDEVNLITPGANYAWPSYMHGDAHPPGYTPPIAGSGGSATWAPSGAAIGVDGKLYVPTLSTAAAGHRMRAFTLSNGTITGSTEYYAGTYGRLRTATAHGSQLYFNTSNNSSDEKVYRTIVTQAPWSAQWVGQSTVPDQTYTGDEYTVHFDYKNTGSQAWSSTGANPVRLGASNSRDRASRFRTSDWISPSRPTTFDGRVETNGSVTPTTTIVPGETARFAFKAVPPPDFNDQVLYREYFTPVVEGVQWMQDVGAHLSFRVTTRGFYYDWAGQVNPPAVMNPGQRAGVRIDIRNTNQTTWRRDTAHPINLGTNRPRDRHSPFFNETWATPTRHVFQGKIVTGALVNSDSITQNEMARFQFDMVAPATPGLYREYFNLVFEGHQWLGDFPGGDRGIFLETYVRNPNAANYDFAYAGQSPYPTLPRNGTAVLKLQLRNTGKQTWVSNGATPFRLGTDRPRDRQSGFSDNGTAAGWTSTSRIKLTRNLTDASKNVGGEATVAEGEVAEFEFTIRALPPAGTYREYFRPLVESVTNFRDLGIFWDIRVT